MEFSVGDKFLVNDKHTILNIVRMEDGEAVLLPFNNTEFAVVGPIANVSGLLEGATKLTELDFKRRMVAFDAWNGTKDQDDNQPADYLTDFESFWSTADEDMINRWFKLQGHSTDEELINIVRESHDKRNKEEHH